MTAHFAPPRPEEASAFGCTQARRDRLPPGEPEVAHQIINTGQTTMRYLALSTLANVETCEYPDSGKISIVAGRRGEPGFRKIFRAESTVDYYDGEKT